MYVEAVIVGAGRGLRLGGPMSKVFLPLGAHPVFLHSVLAFASLPEVDGLVLVVPAGEEERVRTWCRERNVAERVRAIVPGGERRQDSVARGLSHVAPGTDAVLVHDAARPFVRPALIQRVLAAALAHGAAVPGVPVADTLKAVNAAGRVTATVERAGLMAVQTPQGFQKRVLDQIMSRAAEPGWEATDEAGLAERLGLPVTVVPGDAENFKLTTPWDYTLAQCLERSRAV
jgi:2-C-methyl-D-erythritol 4-phosphate cytidylyltransferase